MRYITGLTSAGMFLGSVAVLVCGLSAFPILANAQNGSQGQDAVYNSSNIIVGSSAFIDANTFLNPATQGRDLCDTLFYIFTHTYPSTGAVIDARGISGAATLTCTHGSPWKEGTTTVTAPSTILLPATGGATPTPIIISAPWIVPSNTHLIGEGDGVPGTGTEPGTIIQASPTFSASSSMIQFGDVSPVCPLVNGVSICTGISVEKLTLDGEGQFINGITNGFAQEISTVDHVSLYQIMGTSLLIQGSAQGNASNSGPYSNITSNLGGNTGTIQTVCANINGLTSTRGIHGLTCISPDNVSPAAVLLDSSNNSLEDVRIVGFFDGIRVGANADAQSNVLMNVIGDTDPTIGVSTPIIVVHITNLGHTVSDLSIMGANNAGGSTGTITLQDDLTGSQILDTSVGIYALGESVNGAHSRYTTSNQTATWAVGNGFPTGNCVAGSLYSCTGGSTPCTKSGTPYALWGCPGGTSPGWLPIK